MIYFFIVRALAESLAILNFSFRSYIGLAHYGPKAKVIIIIVTVLLFALRYRNWPEPLFTWSLNIWAFVLGALLFFLLLSVCYDILRLLIGLIGQLKGGNWWNLINMRKALPYLLGGTAILAAYGYYSAAVPVITHLSIISHKLPADVAKIRIVQLSDVHLGRLIGAKQLGKMLELVKQAEPDIFVVTGDLVDDDLSHWHAEAQMLADIKAKCGKFAVTGNHERYNGDANAISFIKRASLKLLSGEAEKSPCGIIVAGLDDEIYTGRNSPIAAKLLAPFKDSKNFILLLKHRPLLAPDSGGLFDLQLSGHTHGGQMWPAHYIAKHDNGYVYGLHKLPGGGSIYVSSGSGYWGMPMRFFSKSEVVVIDLVRQ